MGFISCLHPRNRRIPASFAGFWAGAVYFGVMSCRVTRAVAAAVAWACVVPAAFFGACVFLSACGFWKSGLPGVGLSTGLQGLIGHRVVSQQNGQVSTILPARSCWLQQQSSPYAS